MLGNRSRTSKQMQQYQQSKDLINSNNITRNSESICLCGVHQVVNIDEQQQKNEIILFENDLKAKMN
jgi:hypothetical protein